MHTFFDNATCQDSKVCVSGDNHKSTVAKRQQAMKIVFYTVFFNSTGLLKARGTADRYS